MFQAVNFNLHLFITY